MKVMNKFCLLEQFAPLGEPPPFDLETPWDDGFMLKPQVTVPNMISPFHRGVRVSQLQGDEDALALPVIVTQVPPQLGP